MLQEKFNELANEYPNAVPAATIATMGLCLWGWGSQIVKVSQEAAAAEAERIEDCSTFIAELDSDSIAKLEEEQNRVLKECRAVIAQAQK